MYRWLSVLVLLLLSAVLVGYSGGMNEGEPVAYRVVDSKFVNEDVEVKYPQIEGLCDAVVQNAINNLLAERSLAPHKETIDGLEGDESYEADGTYDVKFISDKVLSIAFSSYNNITPSAHPYIMFSTVNIDMKTGKELMLTDLVQQVDYEFVEALKKAEYKGEVGEDFIDEIREMAFGWYEDDDNLINALTGKVAYAQIGVYFTGNALGISMPVAHVAGDHAEFEIKGDEFARLGLEKWL